MAYPVAYRKGASPAPGVPGFQGDRPALPPKPANDNWPPSRWDPPKPANDNEKGLGGVGPKAKPFARRGMRLARFFNRANRFGNFADMIVNAKWYWDVSQLEPQPVAAPVPDGGSAGWTLALNCGCGPPSYFSSGVKFTDCGGCVALPGGGALKNAIYGGNASQASLGVMSVLPRRYVNGSELEVRVQFWTRPFGLRGPFPFRYNLAFPAEHQALWTEVYPLTRPGQQAVTKPLPWSLIPYRRLNPWLSPTEQSNRFYDLGRSPRHWPDVTSANFTAPGMNPGPVTPHKPVPPGKGVKERKTRLRKGAAAVLKAAYTASEAIDAIDAVHDALPSKYQAPKGATPQEKLAAIYRHSDKLDMNEVVLNLIKNHIIDYVIGSASGRAGDFLGKQGISGYGQWV